MKKLSKSELIDRANNVHNFKYLYDFDNYNTIKDKVTITCPTHGEFKQSMSDHLNGHGCQLCAIEKNANKKRNIIKDLIDRANKTHNYSYDYSNLTNHKSMHDKIGIICPKHGIFNLSLHSHINKKRGCQKCAIERATDTKDVFIEKANNIHNNKYNYDNVFYSNSRTKVEIVCPKHGSFLQKPCDHLHSKAGCPICKESKGERLVSNILQSYNINYSSVK